MSLLRATWLLSVVVLGTSLAATLGVGCADPPPGDSPRADGGSPPDGVLPTGPPSVWATAPAADLFAVDHVPQVQLTVPEDRWQWLQANAKDEQYVPAQATYEGRPAGLVGLRFKGSYGTLVNCFDSSNRLTCAKLSFKVSFEEYDPSNRFFHLKKINLHSMIHDPTKIHERLAYDLYRASGVHAPRSTWANVTVNGRSYGLFSLVEEVDGRFTADRWPTNGDGNLYKEAWPTWTPVVSYGQKLATNKTTTNHDALKGFARDLAAASTSELAAAALGKWMDLPSLYRYMAVDDATVNCDGITAFYAPNGTGAAWGNHNFYLYQEQTRPFFWLIPWDMDATMSTCPFFAAVPQWNTVPANCDQNYTVWAGSWVKPAGCDRVFQALAQAPSGYRAAVDELLAGPFAADVMAEQIDHWSAFIRDAVAADPTGPGAGNWSSAVQQLKGVIPVLRERLLTKAALDARP